MRYGILTVIEQDPEMTTENNGGMQKTDKGNARQYMDRRKNI